MSDEEYLPCDKCGHGIDAHVGLGLPCPVDPARAEIHRHRMRQWPSRWRCLLLRIALGRSTFDYMLRSIKNDIRTPGARLVDIVVRQDAREVRTEADWIKTIAQWAYHLPRPESK